MQNKKGQSEVITTVLIILLVLAAVVIVWQVVNSTISNASSEIESQSECLAFVITLGDVKAAQTNIIGYPNKKVDNIKFYVNGRDVATSGPLLAGVSFEKTGISPALTLNDVITAVGTINGQLCDGKVIKKV